ncbi:MULTISPECIES: SDR family oxidoreductase [Bradyrhizobium]|uniref:SDR family oxidoreductase n=1 Tax=Bradyrhizobium TaxID=374 RepID=UPI0009B6C7B4|nr:MULTISPECIES: SDR family NAD(P)-dependent oxidoreductase [Bradyrhizobium]WLC01468.1 SDR family NAD(P)-dependent oxidoreductase [Bradyrhizobium japonicum USDA 123]MBR0947614.1 SDR family NAD(P)-dependent oxidoreductase [Bradyrhizobium liaoningense]MBR1003555.1 SDR family NAD(P)-dependent oxidoreductase [Bradyrhizobium liaoningense]MBR1031065.1 SDR family NAD(P)-dependent oxidoreductase [Bradyrhizobium liaoningense]MBR1070930.1 SDR family NAD(P)-dependent oxidoreductase [Bradyrhizobium liaoni
MFLFLVSPAASDQQRQRISHKRAKIAVADINEAKAEDVARAIRNTGGESRVYPVDVTQKEQVRATVAKVAQDFGSLDTLINCAGIMFVRPLIEINTVEWETTVDLNVKGALWAIAAVLPVFMRQQRGHIINLSSIHGLKVSPGGAVHSASKFALPYCLICRCYPGGAIADDDPMSADRLRQVAFPACSTRGAVGGSGPT